MSTHFDADWLALREGADRRARAAALLPPLTDWLPAGPLQITDLGAGTGSNLRYLAPILPGPQHWTLVDQDRDLLERAQPPLPAVTLERRVADLVREPLPPVPSPHLVTTAALLDLVSGPWLETLAARCRELASAVLLTLSVDGRIRWQPADADDALVRDCISRHQGRDKGFGPALGPVSGAVAEAAFRDQGYRAWLSPSPWRIGPEQAALQAALLAGWHAAARETAPQHAARLDAWAERRRRAIDAGIVTLTVGHVDLLALPPEPR
ncbi:MAG: class I SAM-dependent methyltransferase [Ectothiorhodospiraceae bacterium]